MIAAEAEPIARRVRFYVPAVDPDLNPSTVDGNERHEPTDEHPANVATSLLWVDGKVSDYHAPALDIDIPCQLLPSSTPGRSHLYFPTVHLDAEAYFALLDALVVAGIMERRYVDHSRRRGFTSLRLPGVRKHSFDDYGVAP